MVWSENTHHTHHNYYTNVMQFDKLPWTNCCLYSDKNATSFPIHKINKMNVYTRNQRLKKWHFTIKIYEKNETNLRQYWIQKNVYSLVGKRITAKWSKPNEIECLCCWYWFGIFQVDQLMVFSLSSQVIQ